jgi:FKBP-type peptidyl-prolyl cis-trans isomerase
MKTSFLTLIALLLALNINAQQQVSKPAAQQTAVKLSSKADTLQYALGAFVGSWLTKNNFTINNSALFNRGMEDVLQNKPRAVVDSTITPIIAAYQLSTQNEKSRLMEAQLFAALKNQAGVGALPDGVQYIVIKAGKGVRPMASDTIVFNAVGVFPDGTLFEDTYKKNQPITNITSNLIPGLSEAIQLMPEGSVWRIFIPSAQAYGPVGLQNVIPPYSALVFDITLEKVKR